MECKKKTEEINIQDEKIKKKKRKRIIFALAVMIIGIIILVFNTVNMRKSIKAKTESVHNAKVGDCIIFGAYEQDNNRLNGPEDIEWLVLEKKENKLLVASKYALERKAYHNEDIQVTWENCMLRDWLNITFVNIAFDRAETKMIRKMKVSADENPEDSIQEQGNDTRDKVFLLSIKEADGYFKSDNARKCEPTDYVKANELEGNNDYYYWLRTKGNQGASIVNYDGVIIEYGNPVNESYRISGNYDEHVVVRPAMWIDLDS